MIIGLCGFIDSGKSTATKCVEDLGFQQASFAESLKDAVAAIFGWDRDMLEGLTAESRAWREAVDPWWAERLRIPHLTPRWALQHFGLGVCREHLHEDLWIASLERRLLESKGDLVVSDARFPSELDMIRARGGIVVRIERGDEPAWADLARRANGGDEDVRRELATTGIHRSETALVGYPCDFVVKNDSTLEHLRDALAGIVRGKNNHCIV